MDKRTLRLHRMLWLCVAIGCFGAVPLAATAATIITQRLVPFSTIGFGRIVAFDTTTESLTTIANVGPDARGFAYEPKSNRLFWADVQEQKIFRSRPFRNEREEIIDFTETDAFPINLRVDSNRGHLYWESGSNTISKSNLDGSLVETFTVADTVGHFDIDTANQRLYVESRFIDASSDIHSNIIELDVTTGATQTVAALDFGLAGLAVNPLGKTVYLGEGTVDTNVNQASLFRLDLVDNSIDELASFDLRPGALSIDFRDGLLYTTLQSGAGADEAQFASIDYLGRDFRLIDERVGSAVQSQFISETIVPIPPAIVLFTAGLTLLGAFGVRRRLCRDSAKL